MDSSGLFCPWLWGIDRNNMQIFFSSSGQFCPSLWIQKSNVKRLKTNLLCVVFDHGLLLWMTIVARLLIDKGNKRLRRLEVNGGSNDFFWIDRAATMNCQLAAAAFFFLVFLGPSSWNQGPSPMFLLDRVHTLVWVLSLSNMSIDILRTQSLFGPS